MVSGGPGRRRWEFMRLPGESLDELNSEATAWRLLARWGVNPDDATLERHVVYRFQARWVEGWRRGRMLLAGDAAHQMPPFAGQGMCAGVRDAANLAWKLDLVLAGRAPQTLLDSYERERVEHVRTMIAFSMELGRVICIADPQEAAARDAAMIAAAAQGAQMPAPAALPIGAGITRAGDPLTGHLFVQGRVRWHGQEGLFDAVVGRGWVLLAADGDPLAAVDAGTAGWFAELGGLAVHGIEDLDGTYRRWFAEHGVSVVLQRPDFYLFGAGGDAGELLRDLRAALS